MSQEDLVYLGFTQTQWMYIEDTIDTILHFPAITVEAMDNLNSIINRIRDDVTEK